MEWVNYLSVLSFLRVRVKKYTIYTIIKWTIEPLSKSKWEALYSYI